MPLSSSIFNDVIEWFLGRTGDRRQYKRRSGAFHVWYQHMNDVNNLREAVGTEISANGLVFMTKQPVDTDDTNLIAQVADRRIPIRVRRVRSDEVEHKGVRWHRYMCNFIGISADNWDVIVNYVNEEPLPPDRRKMQNQEFDNKVDDAYRLLPLAVQDKIVELLVEAGRLAAPKPGSSPLLKLFYGGVVKSSDKVLLHRFNVHSRVQGEEDMMAYDTRFLIDETGNVKLQK